MFNTGWSIYKSSNVNWNLVFFWTFSFQTRALACVRRISVQLQAAVYTGDVGVHDDWLSAARLFMCSSGSCQQHHTLKRDSGFGAAWKPMDCLRQKLQGFFEFCYSREGNIFYELSRKLSQVRQVYSAGVVTVLVLAGLELTGRWSTEVRSRQWLQILENTSN